MQVIPTVWERKKCVYTKFTTQMGKKLDSEKPKKWN
jgi:hypothetical protein